MRLDEDLRRFVMAATEPSTNGGRQAKGTALNLKRGIAVDGVTAGAPPTHFEQEMASTSEPDFGIDKGGTGDRSGWSEQGDSKPDGVLFQDSAAKSQPSPPENKQRTAEEYMAFLRKYAPDDSDAPQKPTQQERFRAGLQDAAGEVAQGFAQAGAALTDDKRGLWDKPLGSPNIDRVDAKEAAFRQWLTGKNQRSSGMAEKALPLEQGEERIRSGAEYRDAMAPYLREKVNRQREDLEFRKEQESRKAQEFPVELETKRVKLERLKGAPAAAQKAAEKKSAAAKASSEIPYRSGRFVVAEGSQPPDEPTFRKVVDRAANSEQIINSMERAKGFIREVMARPADLDARARVSSLNTLIAPRINVTQGQGAMAEPEAARMRNVVGNVDSAEYWVDLARRIFGEKGDSFNSDEASRAIARIEQAQEYFDGDARTLAKASRLMFQGGDPAQPQSSPPAAKAGPVPDGTKKIIGGVPMIRRGGMWVNQ